MLVNHQRFLDFDLCFPFNPSSLLLLLLLLLSLWYKYFFLLCIYVEFCCHLLFLSFIFSLKRDSSALMLMMMMAGDKELLLLLLLQRRNNCTYFFHLGCGTCVTCVTRRSEVDSYEKNSQKELADTENEKEEGGGDGKAKRTIEMGRKQKELLNEEHQQKTKKGHRNHIKRHPHHRGRPNELI